MDQDALMTPPGPLTENEQGLFTPDGYIRERLEQYQGWYDRKAVATKALYLRIRTSTVVGGACVPALINVDARYIRVVTTLLSLMVVILVSLESVYHYREQWKNYRSTEQLLGHEKVFFRTGTGPYEGLPAEQAFKLLVERVEAAIAAENSATLSVMTLAPEDTRRD
jgi:hypothetical protein